MVPLPQVHGKIGKILSTYSIGINDFLIFANVGKKPYIENK